MTGSDDPGRGSISMPAQHRKGLLWPSSHIMKSATQGKRAAMRQAPAPDHLPHPRLEILWASDRADRHKPFPALLRS